MKHAVAMALVGTLALATETAAGTTAVERLVAALLGSTPVEEDLRVLTDEIGGRATGSEANRRSVEWALERFRNAGVDARAEVFTMPELWLERSTRISIEGDVTFRARAVAMPFTPPTPPEGHVAPLLDGGTGSAVDFARLGSHVRTPLRSPMIPRIFVQTREKSVAPKVGSRTPIRRRPVRMTARLMPIGRTTADGGLRRGVEKGPRPTIRRPSPVVRRARDHQTRHRHRPFKYVGIQRSINRF